MTILEGEDTNVDTTSTPAEVTDELDLEGVDNEDFTEDELAEIEKLKAGDDDPGDGGDNDDDGEPGGDNDDEPGDDTKPPAGFVSINALHEARSLIKELKEEIAPLKQFKDTLTQRLLENRGKKPEEQQEEIPDENKDPVGAIAWLKNHTKKLEEQLAARDNRTKEEREKADRDRQEAEISAKRTEFVLETANSLLEKAVAKSPDVQEAFEAGIQGLKATLERKGFKGQELEKALNQSVYQYAFNAPNNPDEFAEYVRANARYFGWNLTQPKKDDLKNEETAAQKISRLKKAKAASRTLGDGGGGNEIGLADLANMSAEELEELAVEHPELFEAAANRD